MEKTLPAQSEIEIIAEGNRGRAAMYRVLASLLFKELSEDQIEELRGQNLAEGVEDEVMAEGLDEMCRYLACTKYGCRQALASDYAHTFLAAGGYEERYATPFESVFTSKDGLIMQDARDDVYRTYRMEGLNVEQKENSFVPEDHLSIEFEFMATLCDRHTKALEAGDANEADRILALEAEFSKNHQMNWVDALCDIIDSCAQTHFYKGVGKVVRGFVHQESQLLAEEAGNE